VLPTLPGICRATRLPGKGMAASENTTHLADRHTALQPAKDTADLVDVGL
jgi:hypothetical protein